MDKSVGIQRELVLNDKDSAASSGLRSTTMWKRPHAGAKPMHQSLLASSLHGLLRLHDNRDPQFKPPPRNGGAPCVHQPRPWRTPPALRLHRFRLHRLHRHGLHGLHRFRHDLREKERERGRERELCELTY